MAATITAPSSSDEATYKRRISAWTMYDWANSAFATTILAAVLPVYFSQVAGSTLPSPAVATAYWSFGLSISLLLVAILSPILGTISDVARSKKRMLAFFASLGILSTALLVLVETGDWVLASILGILGRIGFNGANSFYDSLLPHVARHEDQDRVSARGYAMGYLGGGLLLAINVVMINFLPGTWGARLSFLSVAIWWAVFSIPLMRLVPEPPAATAKSDEGKSIIVASFSRLAATLKDIRQYRELFKFLIAFLIYNDGIGTIIGVAAIYGAELGFSSVELILALLLVQFVGIPYSLIFGRLPSRSEKRRPFFLGFVIFNIVALPLTGILGARMLPVNVSGKRLAPFADTATAAGQGSYAISDERIQRTGTWQSNAISKDTTGLKEDVVYLQALQPGAQLDFAFNGQQVEVVYGSGPDHGTWIVQIDGQTPTDKDGNLVTSINTYSSSQRYELSETFVASEAGEHTLSLINAAETDPLSQGNVMSVRSIIILPPTPKSNLGMILGLIIGVEAICLGLAWLLGKALFSGLAERMDTKRSVLLALVIYAVIAVWGYFLDSVVEFWTLAWMVSIVQGGSQALSRSIYAGMSPAAKSGEFFGMFGVMEKFSAIIGPLLFALAGTIFGSSRPAVLSLIALFIIGGLILTRVNIAEGQRTAQQEDALLLKKQDA
ncbi:MAG: MFS transporter [Anaerolineales bacterium]|nr:MFS transporter [Anaerolineales bacterium]